MCFFSYNEKNLVDCFYVTSDYDRNKTLYFIDEEDRLNYIAFIASDSIVAMSSHYDARVADYIYTKKERGSLK